MTFCYIKYSSTLGNRVQLGAEIQDDLSHFRVTAPKVTTNKVRLTRSSTISAVRVTDAESISEQFSGQRPYKLTNQLAAEKSLALIDKYLSSAGISLDDIGCTNTSSQSFTADDDAAKQMKMNFMFTDSSLKKEKYSKAYSSKSVKGTGSKKLRMPADNNQVLLINPDCCIQIILDYIYNKLGIDKTVVNLDLCDECGNALEVHKMKPYQNALEKLVNRKTYYLITHDSRRENTYRSTLGFVPDAV